MKIFDVFPYNNEVELLELRIQLLRGHVTHFIISEGDLTHTGEPRESRLIDDLNRLGLNGPDISVIEAKLPTKAQEKNNWKRENTQRDVAEALLGEMMGDDDIAIITDCDEIINPKYLDYYCATAKKFHDRILHIPMWHLNGRADLQVVDDSNQSRFWAAGFMCLKHHFAEYGLSEIRESYTYGANKLRFGDLFCTDNGVVEKAGWHFSWMGNSDRMVAKFKSIADFNDFIFGSIGGIDNQKNLEHIKKYVPSSGKTDPLGRRDHVLRPFPLADLPQKIFELPNVKKFLLPETEKRRKTIIFYEETLGVRGTTQAMYDYAWHARELLDMNVFIAYSPRMSSKEAIEKFRKEFPIAAINDTADMQRLIDNTSADYLYDIEFGCMKGWEVKNVKYLVHSVFCTDLTHKHGDVYATVSEAQSKKSGMPWVPHMCSMPKISTNLRKELGIPDNAYVFGRHGGLDTFDVQFVKDAIPEILAQNPQVWFLFMNTEIFIKHERVIYFPATVDVVYKAEFINTCDAMIHARSYGETFGLAVLEFAWYNKPVFTFIDEEAFRTHLLGGSSHLDILGDNAIRYHDKTSLLSAVNAAGLFEPKYQLEKYTPAAVMKKFKEVFLS